MQGLGAEGLCFPKKIPKFTVRKRRGLRKAGIAPKAA